MQSPKASELPVRFDEVVLRFWRQTAFADESVFQAQVRRCPLPMQGGAFRVPVEQDVAALRQLFENEVKLRHGFAAFGTALSGQYELADLGQHLYELLPLSLREEFPRVIQHVAERGRGLRLVVEARAGEQADKLLNVPWELLFYQTPLYAAHSPRLQIVRRLLDSARRQPAHLSPPFGLVHVIAESPERPVDPALQAMEKQVLKSTVGAEHYRLIEKPGTLARLVASLEDSHPSVFHFLGHGDVSKSSSGARDEPGGALLFANGQGHLEPITGERLQYLLGGVPGIQLVVLSACQSASLGGVAFDLVYSGFPYVVAMQGTLSQEAAKHFTLAFYQSLQEEGKVEAAVAAGRAAIVLNMAHGMDWCLPVLYTNEGVEAKPLLPQAADRLGQALLKPQALRAGSHANLGLGALELAAAVLAWLSHGPFALPLEPVLWNITSLLALLGPVLAVVVWFGVQRRVRARAPNVPWKPTLYAALLIRLWGAASMGLGVAWIYGGFVMILLAALGAWNAWSALAQGLAVAGLAAAAFFLSYQQLREHGLGYLTSAMVNVEQWDWRELSLVVGGYILLFLPWAARRWWAEYCVPPLGNVVTAMFCLALAYILYKQSPGT